MAAATTSIAGARDATDTSRAPCKFFILFYFSYYTTIFFLGSVMAATAAEARDATRLEPLVCYIYIYILY